MTEIDAGAIRGITLPMTTPLTETGAIDDAAFRAEMRFLLDAGVYGLVVRAARAKVTRFPPTRSAASRKSRPREQTEWSW